MTTALNAAQVWAASLNDAALASHIRKVVENPRFFGKSQREALLTEAANRFDGIRRCPGCGTTEKLVALSRFDNRTPVCTSCGTREGYAVIQEGRKLVAPGKVEGWDA